MPSGRGKVQHLEGGSLESMWTHRAPSHQPNPGTFACVGSLLHFYDNVIFFLYQIFHVDSAVSGSKTALTELQILTSQINCVLWSLYFWALGNEPRASFVVGEHSTDDPVVLLNHVPGVLDASCIELSVESLALVVVTYKSNTRRQRGPVL